MPPGSALTRLRADSLMVLIVDNFDSFTWNIVHLVALAAPGTPTRVIRADRVTPASAVELSPSHLIVSPGPCGPADAGGSVDVIRALGGQVPILGICLGHQCIAHAFGLAVVRARRPVHGMTSPVRHDGAGVLSGLPSPFEAMRYHSLVVDPSMVDPSEWTATAWTDDPSGPLLMGLRRRWGRETGGAPLEGVQFHPESFATALGVRMMANFLAAAAVPASVAAG